MCTGKEEGWEEIEEVGGEEEKGEERKKEFLRDSKQSELGSPGTAVMEAGLC